MAINYATLTTEIQSDPRGYGYATPLAAGSDTGVADLLNRVRDGTGGPVPNGTVPLNPTAAGGVASGIITIRRTDITGSEVFHAILTADLVNSPNALQAQWYNALITAPFPIRLLNADGSATPVRDNVIALVRAGTPTLQRLGALETRPGSRAEELFGPNTRVSADDVARALGRG